MDFPLQLSQLFKDAQGKSSEEISKWSDEIEDFLGSTPRIDNRKDVSDTEENAISQVSYQLFGRIISSIDPNNLLEGVSSIPKEEKVEEIALMTKRRYLEAETKETINFESLSCLIRAARNLLRWYIQIYLDQTGRKSTSFIQCLQSKHMIELLVSFLEDEDLEKRRLGLTRDISLYIFYATYCPFPGEEESLKCLEYLIFDLSFTDIAIKILMRPSCTAALMLSVVRNIHTALVTLQGAANKIVETTIFRDPSLIDEDSLAIWIPKERSTNTFTSICIDLVRWSLDSDPEFPGVEDDRRADLVLEILGAFYALRMGKTINPNTLTTDNSLLQLSLDILTLTIKSDEKRINQCKCAVITMLMDSDPTIGVELLKYDAVNPILSLFESQVTNLVENLRVDDSAAATTLPLLVLLNRFAATNANLRQIIKHFIFPAEAEQAFQEKVRQQRRTTHQKNMQALDAPKGTFRWKLISLMTWPQSQIKRFTGELFWTLCSSDANEFVHRIGFGNGMPLLGAKGLVQMPQESDARVHVL